MYITMSRNLRGNLEIDENVLNKQIEFTVNANIKNVDNVSVITNIYHENSMFILIKIYISNFSEVILDKNIVNMTINEVVNRMFHTKPKKISIAYIHSNK